MEPALSEYDRQETWRSDVRQFIKASIKHYHWWLGASAGCYVVTWIQFVNFLIPWWVPPILASIGVAVCTFLSWRDANRNFIKSQGRVAELEGARDPLEFLDQTESVIRSGKMIFSVRVKNNAKKQNADELKVEVLDSSPTDNWHQAVLPAVLPIYSPSNKSINPSTTAIIDLFELMVIQVYDSAGGMKIQLSPNLIYEDSGISKHYVSKLGFDIGEEFSIFANASAKNFPATTKQLVCRFIRDRKEYKLQLRVK